MKYILKIYLLAIPVSSAQGVDLKQTVKVEELAKLTFLEV